MILDGIRLFSRWIGTGETEENQRSQENDVSWKPKVLRIFLHCAKEGRLERVLTVMQEKFVKGLKMGRRNYCVSECPRYCVSEWHWTL